MGLVSVAVVAVSALLTWVARKRALSQGIIDIPNSRSSHAVPTPRGGGIAIVISASLAFTALSLLGWLDVRSLVALLGGGLAVAIVGMLDDRGHVSAGVRLLVHTVAAAWAVWSLGGLPALQVGDHVISLGIPGHVLAVVGVVWSLNLFNFMDGIDGIAASEAVFIAWGAALLAAAFGAGDVWAPLMFGAACVGFLWWNWPPARIFMGDVGSGYLGYVIAVLALAAMRSSPPSLWSWIILAGAFLADATVTLLRRMLRGELVHQAHRSHAYQHLSRHWGRHRPVTLSLLALNVLWLLPWAWLAHARPQWGTWIAVGSLIPVFVLVALSGAGRRE